MQAGSAQECCRRALDEMLRYLDDEIAPFAAADSFEVLLHSPPELGAGLIDRWLARHAEAAELRSVSARLEHAVRKLHDFASFELLHRPLVERYVTEVSRIVVTRCPVDERADLNRKLARLGQVETVLSHAVELLEREKRNAEHGAPRPPSAAERGVQTSARAAEGDASGRRLNVILRRLHEERAAAKEDLLAHLLAKAILAARDDAQLSAFLLRLPDLGVGIGMDRGLFRLLADRLPGWDVDAGEHAPAFEAASHLLRALRRVVALGRSPEERGERFSELVHVAVEKLNGGDLAQAAAMLELAARMAAERYVEPALDRATRERARAAVDLAALRKAVASPHGQRLLRRALSFFPDLTAESLLARLDGERKREARKLMLSLVEAHGTGARPKVLERLRGYLAGELPDPKGYYRRNAVYLLRRIARAPGEDAAAELALLAQLARPGVPFLVLRETVEALGGSSAAAAARVLVDGFDALEHELLGSRSTYSQKEAFELLDHFCRALARRAERDSIRRVVRHAFHGDARLGDVRARLAHLRECDLSSDPQQLDELIAFLERALPRRVLGMPLTNAGAADVAHILRALGGTRGPTVDRVLGEIAGRFAGLPLADLVHALRVKRSARAAETALGQPATAGEVETFGLPALLLAHADAGSTGWLALSDRGGRRLGQVAFVAGKIARSEAGRFVGLDAICHLFERPREMTFRFERTPIDQHETALDALPAVLEAIRRYDEFEDDRALVPDGAQLDPTALPPALPPGHSDPEFVRAVWRRASSGEPPERCEAGVGGDSQRVRRLYVHWLEQGALTVRR
jgi:hypothetical protein